MNIFKYQNNNPNSCAKSSTTKVAYGHILKSTSLFGGVQVVQIIASLIRGKFIAVFLGTSGLGVYSLLVSATTTVQSIFAFGLDFSAVREISQAKETENIHQISRSIKIFFGWFLFSAITGASMMILAAPWLSNFLFSSGDYTLVFIMLSIVILINILSAAYTSQLQGTRRLKDMAKASVIGSLLSILFSAPIYYFFRINGIVPALILVASITLTINYYFARKIKLEKVNVRLKEILNEGSGMFKLGVARMISGLLGTLAAFLINAFIKKTGSLSDVGLYQAGISISNQYVGVIFASIAVDYFPRIAAVSSNETKVTEMANQQSEIMLLIVTPILITMILTAPLLISILLTDEFLPIANFIRLIAIGVFFQAAKQSMDLISFAKGDTQTFLLLSLFGSSLLLFSTIVGYTISGLYGIGVMFIFHSILCFIVIYYVVHKKYYFKMSKSFKGILIICICPIIIVSGLLIVMPNILGYGIGGFILCASFIYSIYMLDKLIGLKNIFKNFISRF